MINNGDVVHVFEKSRGTFGQGVDHWMVGVASLLDDRNFKLIFGIKNHLICGNKMLRDSNVSERLL